DQGDVLDLDDQGTAERVLRGPLDVDRCVAQGALELVERGAGRLLNLLGGDIEVRDLVLELVDGVPDGVAQVPDAEGKPGLRRNAADHRALRRLDTVGATGGLELHAVRGRRQRPGRGLVELIAG